jgi:tetratricopeptide (TPR) repeat protein
MPGLITNNMALLKVADKLVRGGDYAGALDAILKARQTDPTNKYAEAYEDRVRGLIAQPSGNTAEPSLTGQEQEEAKPSTAAPDSRLAEVVALLDKANSAMARSDFPEALDYLGQARRLDPQDEDIRVLEEQVRGACEGASPTAAEPFVDFEVVLSTLEAYSSEAIALAESGDYDEALHLVTKGFMFDPSNQRLREAEQYILVARQLSDTHQQTIASAFDHYQRLLEQERLLREELSSHINRAKVFFSNGELEDALTETALGYTIDQENEELHDIERSIWKLKNENAPDADTQANQEDIARLIRLHILTAEEFAKNGDFERALDGLAKAYVIDPANMEIKRAEVRIRQAELRHHQAAGSPLKLVYHYDRVVNGE